MLTSALTCSDQDVGVSQQGEHRRAFGALRDGKGGLRRLRAACAFTPILGSVPAQPSSLGSARFVHTAWHRLTYAHTSVLTSGEILEGCSMQSCKAGKKTLMLAYFWRQHHFNPRFPLAFPSARPLSSAEPPGMQ